MTKKCTKCGRAKSIEDFPYHHDGQIRRRRNVCKACYNAQRRLRESGDPKNFQPDVKDLVTVYLNLIHWDPENLRTVDREKYNKHFNLDVKIREFENIEDAAEQRLEEFGYFTPKSVEFDPEGKYLVIGDTFGTHTPECVFQLLQHLTAREAFDGVIVLGHNLDDENIISNLIASFGIPVTLVAIKDELKDLYEQRGYGYDIVQDRVVIGDIVLRNQEHITPYVKTALSQLDPMLFPGRQIVNCTRHEFAVRPTPNTYDTNFIASPGALADPHVVTTINRLILSSGEHLSVRPTNKDSYHKHRKNEVDKTLWERGYIILNHGKMLQRRIHVKENVAYTVSQDTIIDSFGNEQPTRWTMVMSDLHLPRTSPEWIYAIVNTYKPDQLVFNGDVFDCRAFNPHNAYEASCVDLKEELEECRKFFKGLFSRKTGSFTKKLTKETVQFLWGNHEDFVLRFSRQYPQFANFFIDAFNQVLQPYGLVVSEEHTDWLEIGAHTIVHHGSADIYGTGGNNLEKTARTFQHPAIIGHTHAPAIRFGVYRTGCLCRLAQGYNNAGMSNWVHGVAMCYTTGDMDFIELRNWI